MATMPSVVEMLRKPLADLFPDNAEYVDNGEVRLRIIYPIAETVPGQRYSRSIVVSFEREVLAEMRAVIEAGDDRRQEQIGKNVRRLVEAGLVGYDVRGPRDSAHQIYVDSRALDR